MNEKLQQKFFTAQRLYVYEGENKRNAALKAGITEKTIASWITKNNWKQERDDLLKKQFLTSPPQIKNSVLLHDLKAYLKQVSPFLFEQIEPAIDNYITLINVHHELRKQSTDHQTTRPA
jgi:transposase